MPLTGEEPATKNSEDSAMVQDWQDKPAGEQDRTPGRPPLAGLGGFGSQRIGRLKPVSAEGDLARQTDFGNELLGVPGKAGIEARCEFRCWPSDEQFAAMERNLADWDMESEETRTDTYVLWARHPEFLPKLRGGDTFEVKQCLASHGRMERWGLVASSGFPLGAEIRHWLARECNFAPCSMARWAHSPHAFLCQVSIEPDWCFIEATKSRRTFTLGPLRGEVTRLACSGETYLTAALESEDHALLEDIISAPPFSGLANRNYGEFLRDITRR